MTWSTKIGKAIIAGSEVVLNFDSSIVVTDTGCDSIDIISVDTVSHHPHY